ncbi:hypothetical protein SEA_HEXBUG_56 [Gordonia phage Hexbug]|nr:hypothetical protein SEA_ORLA_56 [Gordonia phage Orla]UVK62970.1 hypothetical protein SEA_HEXBUG_56 [Gordonia phage Hexbug]WNN96147.1 hypothetical protein SEA_NODIGI_56 [Gordonia phage Nodigi]
MPGRTTAVRTSRCNQCKEDITYGDPITKDTHGRWVHESCPDVPDVTDPAAYGDVCSSCHLHHRGECF